MPSITRELTERLIPVYTSYYYDEAKVGDEKYGVIKSSVCCWLLNILYLNFTIDNETDPIENLPLEKKEKYWRLAMLHHDTPDARIKAARSAYVLELITSTY